jgi:ribosomal protein S18 acetylase RimI-like enzyme
MFRGPKARNKLRYFMRCGCKYALLYGECYATAERDAVSLWLLPGATHMTPGKMFRAGMFAAPFRFGLRDFKAFSSFVAHTDKVHREAVPEPHYYLLTLGVSPPAQGKGTGGRLLRDLLGRAEREGKPVYLETQRPENVALYQRFGFKVVSDEAIPQIDLRNWGMAGGQTP